MRETQETIITFLRHAEVQGSSVLPLDGGSEEWRSWEMRCVSRSCSTPLVVTKTERIIKYHLNAAIGDKMSESAAGQNLWRSVWMLVVAGTTSAVILQGITIALSARTGAN